MVNNFQSGLTQRRALFELLTDDSVLARLPAPDRQFVRKHIPWTRIVGNRKVVCDGRTVDFCELAVRERERFVLRPNDVFGGEQTFVGASMDGSTWENALRASARVPYVLQERTPVGHQSVPIFQYGEIQRKTASPSVGPQLFNGKMLGAFARLDTCVAGCEMPLTLAPVLLLDAVES